MLDEKYTGVTPVLVSHGQDNAVGRCEFVKGRLMVIFDEDAKVTTIRFFDTFGCGCRFIKTKSFGENCGDIYILEAEIYEFSLDSLPTNKSININNIGSGSKLYFKKHKPGFVVSIMDQTANGGGCILRSSVRLEVKHVDSTSYHWYRIDGQSHIDPNFDIVKIDNADVLS